MFKTYIKLTRGNWVAFHIWNVEDSTKEYEDIGFTVQIINYE